MTDAAKQLEKEQKEQEGDLNELLEDTIRQEWAKNTALWLGVVLGSFVLILLILVAVTGG